MYITHQKINIPSGNLTYLLNITMLLMGKSTISMAIFNSKLLNYQRVDMKIHGFPSEHD